MTDPTELERTARLKVKLMPAQGYQRHNLKRVSIGFDQDTFEDVSKRASKAKTSFAEEVRLLVTIGIETMENER